MRTRCAAALVLMVTAGFSQMAAACDVFPGPVDHLSGESIYEKSDPTKSTVNKVAAADYGKAMAPLWAFVKFVSANATSYQNSNNTAAGACAVKALKTWADASALQHIDSRTARLNFGRNLAGIALAYTKVRDFAEPDDRKVVDGWLNGLAHSASTVFDGDRTKTPEGNLRYWNGLGVAAVANLTGDGRLFDWGMESLRIGLCQADRDGALPLEMARGQKALDYQVYATSALVMLAKLSKAHGRDPMQVCSGALKRIVNFTISASLNPSKVAADNRVPPVTATATEVSGSQFAWISAYQNAFGPIDAAAKVSVRPPFSDPFLGGSVN